MKGHNQMFDDFSKICGTAMDTAYNSIYEAKKNFDSMVRERVESYLKDMNFVSKEEFEAVKKIAKRARSENLKLNQRIEELEAKLKK